jgi:hypothetical protein
MGLLTVGGKEIVKKGGRKAANESAVNLVKGDNAVSKVAGSKTSAANELNLEDFKPRQTYGKFSGKYEQESGKAAREAMEAANELPQSRQGRWQAQKDTPRKAYGRFNNRDGYYEETTKAEEGVTRRTSLAETAAGVRSRAEKDMGMADVVEAAKLSGKGSMSSGSRAAGPSSGGGKAAGIAAGIAGAGSLGVIALMDRNESKEPSKASKASESAPASSSKASKANEGKSDSLADKVKDMSAPKAKKTISDFEKAFAKAREDGDKTFSFKGSEFTTRLKNESVSSFNKKFESQEDFPRRLYDSMENAARYESGEMNALAKGGFVKAKPKAHNGNRTSQPMQYNSIDMGKFMKKPK